MHFKRISMIIAVFLLACSSSVSAADNKPDMALSLTAEKEVLVKDDTGRTKTVYQEVKDTNPGDILRYTILYANKGKTEAKDAVINDPVPEGTSYISSSAEGKDSEIIFSIDGKIFQSPPLLKYKVKQPDGTEAEYIATPDMYKQIRWKLLKPVMPGDSGTLSFKVRVK